MQMNKPTVYIFIKNADESVLCEIFAGLEEEGVLFECFNMEHMNKTAEILALNAAEQSPLCVGIGVCGIKAVMQMRDMDENNPIYKTDSAYRIVGINAAKAVKKMKFVLVC